MVAPEATLDDGELQIVVLAGTSRLQLLSMFLALSDGSHVHLDGLRVLRVKAFRIEPEPRTATAPGLFSVDGEAVPLGPVEAKPHLGALRVLA